MTIQEEKTKMRYQHGDTVLSGADAKAIVQEMRATAFETSRTTREYMLQVSDRAATTTGQGVRTDTEENFVADLVRLGLLAEVPEDA